MVTSGVQRGSPARRRGLQIWLFDIPTKMVERATLSPSLELDVLWLQKMSRWTFTLFPVRLHETVLQTVHCVLS